MAKNDRKIIYEILQIMCLYPKLIKNPKYKMNKKNGGNIPPVNDERVTMVPIGCQTCIECRGQKARDWNVRLQEDIKDNTNGQYWVLTYSTESIKKLTTEIQRYKDKKGKPYEGYKLDNAIAIRSMRYFLERWRKKYGKSLRHWAVTELGGKHTEHLHINIIAWTDEQEIVESIWQYGHVWRGYISKKTGKIERTYVTAKTVNYIVKYVSKVDAKHINYQAIVLTSPGIGRRYIEHGDARKNKYNEKKTEERYRAPNGAKMAIPIYWRNKIYTDEEREKLWLQKLDKNERWVCGELVAADDEKTYNNVLDYHRRRTKQIGYPDPDERWNKREYEEARRILIQRNRIQEKE
ncbi:MAG: putative replication initiation protein [Microviridae sp.]|nr:MAG: putative replication initiation protein [Microviridae sp.]